MKPLLTDSPWKLSHLPGIGPRRAATLLADVELGRRMLRTTDTRPRFSTATAVHAISLTTTTEIDPDP